MKKLLLVIAALGLAACGQDASISYLGNTSTPVQYSQGLSCNAYSILQSDTNGTVNWTNMFADGTLQFNVTIPYFNIVNESDGNDFADFSGAQQALLGQTNFALNCSGILNVPVSGSYTFVQGSDDGSSLSIDGNTVINMPQLQPFTSQQSSPVQLSAGLHNITILYFQGPQTNMGLQLEWSGPSADSQGVLTTVPMSALEH